MHMRKRILSLVLLLTLFTSICAPLKTDTQVAKAYSIVDRIELNRKLSVNVEAGGDYFYELDVNEVGVLNVSGMFNSTTDGCIRVYDSNETEIVRDDDYWKSTDDGESLSMTTELSNGKYYLELLNNSDEKEYSVNIFLSFTEREDINSDRNLSFNLNRDEIRTYRLFLDQPSNIEFTGFFKHWEVMTVYVYDIDGEEIDEDRKEDWDRETYKDEDKEYMDFVIEDLPAGTYYIKIHNQEPDQIRFNADFSIHNGLNSFIIKRDGNSFYHCTGNSDEYYAPEGHTHKISNELFNKLTENTTDENKKEIQKAMDEDEWGGSCYGISMAMALAYSKKVKVEDYDESSFYNIKPYSNVRAREMMEYYYLSQMLDVGGKEDLTADEVYRKSWGNFFDGNYFGKNHDVESFLRGFISAVKANKISGQPVVFGFRVNGEGHVILACGCSEGSEYRVKLYDMNGFDNGHNDFIYMTVSKDYSEFSFPDGSTTVSEDNYDKLYYLYPDLVATNISKIKDEYTYLTATGRCRITNSEGKYLEIDGAACKGNMDVYNSTSIESGTNGVEDGVKLCLPDSDTYSIEYLDNDTDCVVYNSNKDGFYSASGTGISEVVVSPGAGMRIEGESSIGFKAYISENNQNMMSVDGNGNNSISFSMNNSGDVGVESKNKLHLSEMRSYNEADVDSRKTKIDGKNLSITYYKKVKDKAGNTYQIQEGNGLILIKTKNKKLKSITIPDTVMVDGVKHKVCSISKKSFKGCKKLKKVVLGKNINNIGAKTFCGFKKIKSITIKSSKLNESNVGKNAFSKLGAKVIIYVPKSKLKAYKKLLKSKGLKGKKQKIKAK